MNGKHIIKVLVTVFGGEFFARKQATMKPKGLRGAYSRQPYAT